MSTNGDDNGPGRREVAYRLFAAEFEDADFSYAESDEERAPNYVVTPTGARVNRLFVVGVLTEIDSVGEDVLRARVVDPTGAFVVYAGQYQPDAKTFLERAQAPSFVAVSGKARTFSPDDSDVVYTSIRPESINEVDADTRDRWTVQTAEQTLERVGVAAGALQGDARGESLRDALLEAGVDEALSAGVPLALDHYGTTGAYLSALRNLSLDAARVVAGEKEEVGSLSRSPAQGGDGDLATLASLEVEAGTAAATTSGESAPPADDEPTASSDDEPTVTATSDSEPTVESTADSEPAVESTADSEPAVETTVETDPADSEPKAATATADSEPTAVEESTSPTGDESTSSTGGVDAGADDDLGDFESSEEFDLDEETREEVEEEFGTEFQSGAEVDEPGEADIETPDPEELAEAAESGAPADAADAEPAPGSSGAPAGDASTEPDADAATSDAVTETPETATDAGADEVAGEAEEQSEPPAEDVNIEDAVMETMEELDDGDGADRETLVETVVEQYGATTDEVEDAIQNALMGGRCYEPDDTTLKSI